MFETKRTIEGKQTIETIETERLTRFNTGNQTNVRHIVNAANAVNSAPFGIENVTLCTRISVSRVNFSPCYWLTWQKRGDSNNNTTS